MGQEVRSVLVVLLGTGALPLWAAWRANRRTSLVHTIGWAAAAWAAWAATAGGEVLAGAAVPAGRYAALCLTGCGGVAVLGARRPGAAAWNFVVAGLLVVLLRPLWEGLGAFHLRGAHIAFLAGTLAVPLLNYLPTRLAPAALVLGCGIAAVLAALAAQAPQWLEPGGMGVVGLAPWLAWGCARRAEPAQEFDALWLDYRDRFGFLWGQRMREQFNHAAEHAGWPVMLHWGGLGTPDGRPADLPQAVATLRAVLKRFGPEEESGSVESP